MILDSKNQLLHFRFDGYTLLLIVKTFVNCWKKKGQLQEALRR